MKEIAFVHSRIEKDVKQEAHRILRSMGILPSQAVRMLYRQICITGTFPVIAKIEHCEDDWETDFSDLCEDEKGCEVRETRSETDEMERRTAKYVDIVRRQTAISRMVRALKEG